MAWLPVPRPPALSKFTLSVSTSTFRTPESWFASCQSCVPQSCFWWLCPPTQGGPMEIHQRLWGQGMFHVHPAARHLKHWKSSKLTEDFPQPSTQTLNHPKQATTLHHTKYFLATNPISFNRLNPPNPSKSNFQCTWESSINSSYSAFAASSAASVSACNLAKSLWMTWTEQSGKHVIWGCI